jgi:phospholipid/cholesterol/gamma-HCH transport system permease protein
MYTAFVALLGSFLDIHQHELTSLISFIEKAFERITFLDLISSIVKSVVFGFTIGAVGCYKGYNASQGTQGVGKAANAAVVLSMFLIFIEEIIIVQITNFIRG